MKKLLFIALSLSILGSCSISNDVASNGFLQKRKYKKGWFVNTSSSYHKTNKSKTEDVAIATPVDRETEVEIAKNESSKSFVILQADLNQEIIKETNFLSSENSNDFSQDNSFSEEIVSENLVETQQITIDEETVENIANSLNQNVKIQQSNSGGDEVDTTLLYVLCFFIPFLAVGLATDWDINKVLINLLLSLLCVIPGIIHAFIVVKNERG